MKTRIISQFLIIVCSILVGSALLVMVASLFNQINYNNNHEDTLALSAGIVGGVALFSLPLTLPFLIVGLMMKSPSEKKWYISIAIMSILMVLCIGIFIASLSIKYWLIKIIFFAPILFDAFIIYSLFSEKYLFFEEEAYKKINEN